MCEKSEMGETQKYRVLELYSGIGGMHCALEESGIPFEVVAAIDINTTANKIYKHNFPGTYLMENGIEKLTVQQIDRMKIDMIVMSPPCQPFTRVGKKLDKEDIRTKSFLHLLDLLPQLAHCPSYILVENVKGFEESQTRELMIKALQKCSFHIHEYMLSPLQFGIPNSRLRYYMIARRDAGCTEQTEISFTIPESAQTHLKYKTLCESETECYHSESFNLLQYLSNNGRKSEEEGIESSVIADLVNGVKTEKVKGHHEIKTEEDEWTLVNHQHDVADHCQIKHSASPISCDHVNIKRIKTEPSTDTDVKLSEEGDVKHSDNEDVVSGCCCCDNDAKLVKESLILRQAEDGEGIKDRCLRLHHFLEKESIEYLMKFKVPDKDLNRFIVMDVVFPCIWKTICFTKRYGHYMEGAGSIIQMSTNVQDLKSAVQLKMEAIETKNNKNWGEDQISIIRKLQLRYFTPREISNLLCFPQSYSFPSELSSIQLYRVLGNSLNVHVVSVLIQQMTREL